MAKRVAYEVYVLQGSRWELHARYPASGKDPAVQEAQILEKTPGVSAVKVIRDVLDEEEGLSEEYVVYKTESARSTGGAPAAQPSNRGGGGRGGGRSAADDDDYDDYGDDDYDDDGGRPRNKKKSNRNIFTKISINIVFGLVLGGILTWAVALALPEIHRKVIPMSGNTSATILFFTFFLTFMFYAVPTSLRSLSKHNFDAPRPAPQVFAAPPPRPKPAAPEPTKADPVQDAKDALDRQKAAEKALAALQDSMDDEDDEEEEEEQKPQSSDTLSPHAEQQKSFLLKFLSASLAKLDTALQKMDQFVRFGINLFIAGACDSLRRRRNLGVEETAAILSSSVEVMGFQKVQAAGFAGKYEEYLLADARYMQMFQAGRNAFSTYSAGDESGATHLKTALIEWEKPKAKEESTGPVTVMFTDMVGSTALTQTRGDAVAQQVVRAHNRIVREALSRFAGREIKHTGDGIMCSFATTSNSVEASVVIQQGVAVHNTNNPDLPLHIKIGINAGEPIQEDDDLFGTTVQLAARIVDKAQSEEIFVSEIVRGICAGKDIKFKNRGGYAMKGFDGDLTLYEVVWGDVGAAQAPAQAPPAKAP